MAHNFPPKTPGGRVVLMFVFLFWAGDGVASKLSPNATKIERMNANKYDGGRFVRALAGYGLTLFTEPVHEEIAQRAYLCDAELDDSVTCSDLEAEYAGPYVIAGTRWNDDPPFRLSQKEAAKLGCDVQYTIRAITQVQCWAKLYKTGEARAAKGRALGPKNANLMWRSHLGDLQFLHGMANKDGEPAYETQRRIMMWMELTWKIASGELRLTQLLNEVSISGLNDHFGTSGWAIQDLFTLGVQPLRAHIRDVAFGSMLHTIGDSFAAGHADRADPDAAAMCSDMPEMRAPGRIREFHAYNKQDHKRHAAADSREAFVNHMNAYREVFRDKGLSDDEIPHVVGIGRAVRAMMFERQMSWHQVKPYFACIFDVENPNTPSSPGNAFRLPN